MQGQYSPLDDQSRFRSLPIRHNGRQEINLVNGNGHAHYAVMGVSTGGGGVGGHNLSTSFHVNNNEKFKEVEELYAKVKI